MTERTSVLLRPTGPLDADTCGDLRHQLAAAFAAGVSSIVVDLGAVTTCDPVGLGVLAGAARHLRRRNGVLVVAHASPAIATSLRINGLGDLLEVPASMPLSVVRGAAEQPERPAKPRLSVVRPGA